MDHEQDIGYAKTKKFALDLLGKVGPETAVKMLTQDARDLVKDRLEVLHRDVGGLTAHAEIGSESARAQLVKFARELRKVAGALDCAAAKAEVEAKK